MVNSLIRTHRAGTCQGWSGTFFPSSVFLHWVWVGCPPLPHIVWRECFTMQPSLALNFLCNWLWTQSCWISSRILGFADFWGSSHLCHSVLFNPETHFLPSLDNLILSSDRCGPNQHQWWWWVNSFTEPSIWLEEQEAVLSSCLRNP